MRVLVVYGTTNGHTRKVADRVAKAVEANGHSAEVVDSAKLPRDLVVAGYDAYILAGSVHIGKHQSSLVRFVRAHQAELAAKPSAFLSISLSAVKQDASHVADAQRMVDQFLAETGWRPTVTTRVAGALLYTKYDWITRKIMLDISKSEGRDTDTSRDYEYTDWDALTASVGEFMQTCAQSVPVLSAH